MVRELVRQLAHYEDFEVKADLQYRLGERSLLEKKLIENSLYELRNRHVIQSGNLTQALADLQFLLASEQTFIPAQDTLVALVTAVDTASNDHPTVRVLRQRLATGQARESLEKSLLFPELSVGYFRQNITETDIRLRGIQGFTFGVAIPLWFRPQQGEIQRSRIERMQVERQLELGQRELANARRKALSDRRRYQGVLDYYREQGLDQAATIHKTATLQIEAGEIDFFQYLQSMQRYTETRLQYLDAVRNYNKAIIQLEYLSE